MFALLAAPARAEDWPRFRGPDGNAVSAETVLPLHWGRERGVRFKTEIPGEGSSSPIVWGDRIFLTSALEKGARRLLHCVDRKTGKVLWTHETRDADPERTSSVTGHAAATPVTDGRRVFAFFGNAGAVCCDLEGKRLWHRPLGVFDTELGLASSPILYKDMLILVCDHDGDRFTSFDSFLIALGAADGKEVWKTPRPGVQRSWASPILAPAGERFELIVSAQDHVRGCDPDTGKELWRCEGTTGWVAPSPVFGLGLVFATSGKAGPTVAVKPGGRGDSQAVWKVPTGGAYYCSPILVGTELYVHDEMGILTCFDARTGKPHYKQRLGGARFVASPVAGAGRILCTDEAGTTFVIKAGKKYELLAVNKLGEYAVASPALSRGEIFLRTEHHLWCIRGTDAP